MSSSEFTDWIDFSRISPFGSERDNLHAALIATTIANGNRGKSTKAYKVSDFMFKSEEQTERDKIQELMAYMQSMVKK